MAFFLRFKPQLQRTRPELIPRLEDMAVRAVEEAGGKITGDRTLLRAVFDENSLGFWLEILLLIEDLTRLVHEAAADLYGYALLIGKDLPETPYPLCRALAGRNGGVFFDRVAAEALRPYVSAEEQGEWNLKMGKYGAGPFTRLREVKVFVPTARTDLPPQETMKSVKPERSAILVTGQSYAGKRDKLYLRMSGIANTGTEGDFFPLFIRFGGDGLNALTDSWAGWMHAASMEEDLSAAWEFLFRERLKDKPSPFVIRTGRHFFQQLLTLYRTLAHDEGKTPVIILENMHKAKDAIAGIVIESLSGWDDYTLLGICSDELDAGGMEQWKPLFLQMTRPGSGEENPQRLPDIPLDLWEAGYACVLLGRYFPPELFPRLFEEAGKSPAMISRAFSLLYALRVIDTPLDPRPWNRLFQHQAEAVLGERKTGIQAMVCKRLLIWVTQQKINPCLHLLEILKELHYTANIDDNLILKSLHGEMINAEGTAAEYARYRRILETAADPARVPVLHYILDTLLAIHTGDTHSIHAAFSVQPPECSAFPLLKAQVQLNLALYFLGRRKYEPAAQAVKEASRLFQGNSGPGIAQAYRIFALATLLQKRIGETIDYLGFALENAAKSGGFKETGMAAYYAASVQLLYGNLSRARKLAEKARRHFLKAGAPEWADRSRFLEGRLAFEIGSYQQAIDIFEDIRQNPDGGDSAAKNNTLEAWRYRAGANGRAAYNPKPRNGCFDLDLFELEALCLTGKITSGDYTPAAQHPGISVTVSAGDALYDIERPDWNSGFGQCELLYFSAADLRERMAGTYRALAQSGASTAGTDEIVRTMQMVLRGGGQFPEIDPFDVTAHYAWYRVLEHCGSSQVNISTAVSVAYKRLLSRAGRIDDPVIRRHYLTQSFWNHDLEQAAQKYKLI